MDDPAVAERQEQTTPHLFLANERPTVEETITCYARFMRSSAMVNPFSVAKEGDFSSSCVGDAIIKPLSINSIYQRSRESVILTLPDSPKKYMSFAAEPSLAAIRALFPALDVTVIYAILYHDLRATDLYKLCPRRASDEMRNIDALDYIRRYPNVQSIVGPLLIYSEILTIHNLEIGRGLGALHGIHRYIRQLLCFAEEFEWAAVLEYHVNFWSSRSAEMQRGVFDGWAEVDEGIRDRILTDGKRCLSNATSQTGMVA